ncbi:MAG: hypothetical protein H6R13_657 [Proteobacteria bacterium]|nr:hypothetical protein [Pseudomonadota bacterium]
MPPPTFAFDVTADVARNNPQAYYAYRSDLISSTIENSIGKAGLYQLQDQIDAQRAVVVSPMHNLAALMGMLEGKLSSLTEVLAHWQTLLDIELPQENPDARLPLARIDAMLASVADLRERLGDTALR